jgi:nitroreductase
MSTINPSEEAYAATIGLRAWRNYRPDHIPAADIEAILEAGRWTGSSKNLQKWRFVVVEGDEALEDLATAGDFTRPIRSAPLAIALVWPEDGYEFDIGRAAQNMMLAAAARGIASCPITLHREDHARQVLGLPDSRRCRYAISFGYPDEAAERAERGTRRAAGKGGRKPLDEMVSYVGS